MPYMKVNFRDNSFSVVQTHKANYPYTNAQTITGGDGWDLSDVWNTPDWKNSWVYLWLYNGDMKELFGGKCFKFNNTVYQISLSTIISVEPCKKSFYHKHKDLVCPPIKASYGIRDSQKSKVYRAENFIHYAGHIEEDDDVVEFIYEVLTGSAWENLDKNFASYRGHDVQIELNPRAKSHATGDYYKVTLPKWARKKGIIIHELAHVAIQRMFPFSKRKEEMIQAHGKEYCFVYLYLLKEFMPDEMKELIKSFDNWNVKYSTEMEEFGLSLGD